MPEDKTIHATYGEVYGFNHGPTLKTQCGEVDHRVFSIVPYDFLRLLDCSSHDVNHPLFCGKCAKVLKGNRKLVDRPDNPS